MQGKVKNILVAMGLSLVMLIGCSEDNSIIDDNYTGRELSYDLVQGSDLPISGTVVFKELRNNSVEIEVALTGTSGDVFHPVHLHFGDLATPDAEIAAMLNELSGETGKSVSNISRLSDDTSFDYSMLKDFSGSIKVHLAASGPDKNVILAGGNIGAAYDQSSANGRVNIAVCRSE